MPSSARPAFPRTWTGRGRSPLLVCTAVLGLGTLVQLPSAFAVPGGGDSVRVGGQTLQRSATDGSVSGSWSYEVPVAAGVDYEVRLGLRTTGTARESSVVVEGTRVPVSPFTGATLVSAVVNVVDGAVSVEHGSGQPLGVASLEVLPVGDPLSTEPADQPVPSQPAPVAPAPAPAPAPARDLFLQPFASTSVWNLPIGTGATFESATDPMTANLLNTGGAWANHATWSHPVDRARDSDPLASVTDRYDSRRSAVYRIPVDARIAAGGDEHMHVVTPDGLTVHETWSAERLSTTEYRVGRHEEVDLRGSGIGPSNGARAYGGSALGGLIRAWEVDPTHPAYTGAIRHPIAVALRNDQLLHTSGTHGYDSAGYGTARGYVWPATEQDSNSPTAYAGRIPMGTYLAIPPSVDVAALGLTPQGLMLARAYQDYGGYVTDRSGETTLAYVEPSAAGSAFAKALLGPDYTAADLKKIRAQLRVVTNNGPSTPNAAPLGAARRASLLP